MVPLAVQTRLAPAAIVGMVTEVPGVTAGVPGQVIVGEVVVVVVPAASIRESVATSVSTTFVIAEPVFRHRVAPDDGGPWCECRPARDRAREPGVGGQERLLGERDARAVHRVRGAGQRSELGGRARGAERRAS